MERKNRLITTDTLKTESAGMASADLHNLGLADARGPQRRDPGQKPKHRLASWPATSGKTALTTISQTRQTDFVFAEAANPKDATIREPSMVNYGIGYASHFPGEMTGRFIDGLREFANRPTPKIYTAR